MPDNEPTEPTDTAETAQEHEQLKPEPKEETEGLAAKIADMQKHISALNEENKNHRLKAKAEHEAKLDALSQNGEYKQLAEALTDKISTLETALPEMRVKADKFDEWTQNEAQRIEKEIEHIPEQWRVVIDHAGDMETKRRILDTLKIGSSMKAAAPNNQVSAPANNQTGVTAKDLADQWLAKKQIKGGLFGR
jgi:chromosome segregation ATPase